MRALLHARHVTLCSPSLRHLLRRGEVPRNAAAELSLPKVRRPLPTFLNVDAAAEVVTAPDEGSAEGLRDRALLETLYGAGLRVSELASLDLASVELRGDGGLGSVRVVGKGSKERVVPVRITDFSITEEAFDSVLNPIRAKVSLSLKVLHVGDLGFGETAGLRGHERRVGPQLLLPRRLRRQFRRPA